MHARVRWDRIDYARLRTPTPRSRSRGGEGAALFLLASHGAADQLRYQLHIVTP